MLMEQSLSLYVDFLVIWIFVHFCFTYLLKMTLLQPFLVGKGIWDIALYVQNISSFVLPTCYLHTSMYVYSVYTSLNIPIYPFLFKNCVQSIRLGGSEVATLQLYLQQQHQNLQQQLQNLLMFQVFT